MKQLIFTFVFLLCSNLIFAGKYLAKYEFNGNSKNSVNGQYATVNGATLTTDRHGKTNGAYLFDGVDDFLEITNGLLNVKNNESFTMETYVYMESTQGYWGKNNEREYFGGALFSLYGAPNKSNDLFLLWYNNVDLIASHRTERSSGGLQQTVKTNATSLFNSYHHIIIVRDGSKQELSLFIDGKLIKTSSIQPAAKISEYPSFVGKHNTIIDGENGKAEVYGTHFFKGKMDYLRFYKRALSPKKVKKRYLKASQAPYKCDYYVKNNKRNNEFNNTVDKALKVYPNPTRGNVFIKADANMDCREIRIYDQYGQIVLRSIFKNHLHTGCLKPGYYTIAFLTPTKNFKRRLVVVR